MILADRMEPEALAAYERLLHSHKADVLSFLQDNPREHLHSRFDVVNAYLTWNGIIGYSAVIISLVRNAYGDIAEKGVAG